MPANVVDDQFGSRMLVWGLDGIEANTIEQAQRTARLPFVESPLALMPDSHWGNGATIGSVIATHGAICPAAVGVDIGCGCVGTQTGLTSQNLPDNLDELHHQIERSVPAGLN